MLVEPKGATAPKSDPGYIYLRFFPVNGLNVFSPSAVA